MSHIFINNCFPFANMHRIAKNFAFNHALKSKIINALLYTHFSDTTNKYSPNQYIDHTSTAHEAIYAANAHRTMIKQDAQEEVLRVLCGCVSVCVCLWPHVAWRVLSTLSRILGSRDIYHLLRTCCGGARWHVRANVCLLWCGVVWVVCIAGRRSVCDRL